MDPAQQRGADIGARPIKDRHFRAESDHGYVGANEKLQAHVDIHGQHHDTVSAQHCFGEAADMLNYLLDDRYSTRRQGRAIEGIAKDITSATAQVRNAIATANNQLPELNAQFQQLRLRQSDGVDSEADRESAISQSHLQQEALNTSIKLLQELLEKAEDIKGTASNTSKPQNPSAVFGNLTGRGVQMVANSGTLTLNF